VRETNLKTRKTGDPVNLEVDILAKYVEKLLSAQMASSGSGSLSRTLSEFGYL
jgi:riboflavin synthase